MCERAACLSVWITAWECIVLPSACESVFWSVHMCTAKMAVNSLRMFLSQLTSHCYLPLYLTHCHVHYIHKQTHTLQHKDARHQWGRAHWLVWGGRRLERRGDQAATMQSVKSMASLFVSLFALDIARIKLVESFFKSKTQGYGNAQWTVNNNVQTVYLLAFLSWQYNTVAFPQKVQRYQKGEWRKWAKKP